MVKYRHRDEVISYQLENFKNDLLVIERSLIFVIQNPVHVDLVSVSAPKTPIIFSFVILSCKPVQLCPRAKKNIIIVIFPTC